ncbi:hypothetical protein GCM10010347_63650 [Streptomyces cirratus]|uniref:Uncharacterized protein n=1 Tax=Streptomyces cirratus TaxID=68187 RepID=A0ABQ3F2K2_9ACTN|nr:hypothetical protein GCM10010347_63650 [Streptomyces cirratus]
MWGAGARPGLGFGPGFRRGARGRHLGSAYLAEAATLEQRRALSSVREKKARALKAELKAAEKLRKTRYTRHDHGCRARPAAHGHLLSSRGGNRPVQGRGSGGPGAPGLDPSPAPGFLGPVRLSALAARPACRRMPGRQPTAERRERLMYVTTAGSVERWCLPSGRDGAAS